MRFFFTANYGIHLNEILYLYKSGDPSRYMISFVFRHDKSCSVPFSTEKERDEAFSYLSKSIFS